MRVLCLTDSLDSGGAQRQLCMLAVLLKGCGYDVGVLTYHKRDFYKSILDDASIPSATVEAASKPARILAVRKAIRRQDPDVVIAYQETPAILAELAGLPSRRFKLIVSERNTDLELTRAVRVRLQLHRLADAVVPNSFAQANLIKQAAPWLASRTRTIVNCVDTDVFRPLDNSQQSADTVNILVVSSFKPQKNPLAMVEAMRIVHNDHGMKNIVVDWYGNNWFVNGQPCEASALYLTAVQRIKDYGLAEVFRLHDPVRDVARLYQGCTVSCLPSLYEGCPNVIGEAMACGKPVLASNVCDNPLLVTDDENGFLFDPADPREIARAIMRFAALPIERRIQFGLCSRARAEHLLSSDVFVGKYIDLITSLTEKYHR